MHFRAVRNDNSRKYEKIEKRIENNRNFFFFEISVHLSVGIIHYITLNLIFFVILYPIFTYPDDNSSPAIIIYACLHKSNFFYRKYNQIQKIQYVGLFLVGRYSRGRLI